MILTLVSAKWNLDKLEKRTKAGSQKDRRRLPVSFGYPKSQNLEQKLLWTCFLGSFLGSCQVSFEQMRGK
jgi:hypothetical protein